jgi:hypothetical protein
VAHEVPRSEPERPLWKGLLETLKTDFGACEGPVGGAGQDQDLLGGDRAPA